MAGRPTYQPTPETRRQVETMTGFGIPQENIARLLNIDSKTLRLHFRLEIDTGMTQANMRVANALYTNAVEHNNVAAQIWWTKARMGWREATDVNLTGTDPSALHLLAARLVSDEIITAMKQREHQTIDGHAEGSEKADVPVDLLAAPLPTE